jgi:ribosomal protein S27AE
MTIDTSGKWWKGTDFADLAEYLRGFTADGYPADEIVQSVCTCGHTRFRVEGDPNEGCARRTCAACGAQTFIADSGEYWDEAEPVKLSCRPCRGRIFEVGVAFSKRENGDVKWITLGERCVRCGVLGSFVEWKIDYSPTDHLLSRA